MININEQYDYMRKVRDLHDGGHVFIQTFGCQQNEADSERLAGMAEEMGYELCADSAEADLILINTCAIREHAELKALSITGQFKHLKAQKPGLLIGICGCMVTQEHRKEDIKHKYHSVDFLFGTGMMYRFPEILYETIRNKRRRFYIEETTDLRSASNIVEGLPVKRESPFKAWVSIMYGCDNFCAYCVVPYVRGRERSRRKEDILNEIKGLADYKEITLLGQNVNSYNGGCDFSDLLAEICALDGDFKIRFMTSHPKDATFKLIDTMAANPKIAKQLHLPLQAGSNAVLAAMNRGYTKESYLQFVEYLRVKIPDAALSTDIIVGFPGETDADFAETIEMLEKIRFDSIFSFIYSKRVGTKAAEMDNQIPEDVINKRFAKLLEVQNEISKSKNLAYENTIIKVLCEGKSKTDANKYTGRNEKNRLVHFEADDSYVGKYVDVLIERADTYALHGRRII